VQAYNQYGSSAWSNEACDTTGGNCPPAAPSNLVASAVSASEIDLTWVDNSDDEDGFVIEVDEGNTGTFVYLDTVGPNVTEYPDTGLTEGLEYCYRVYAFNTYGDSDYSNVSCATLGEQVVVVSSVEELRAAVAAATPGTIIEMTDGTYTWSDTASCCTISDKTNLTIRSQSGNRDAVVVQGLGISSRTTQFCFKLYRSDYITFENFTMKDVYWHCVQVNEGSEYATFRNLVMWDAGEGPIKGTSPGTSGPYCDYGLVEDCAIGYTDTGERSCVEGIDLVACNDWVIQDCEFYKARKSGGPAKVGWGFFAKGNSQDTVVDDCYFEDCDIAISFGGGGTSSQYFRDGDETYEHRRGIMKNNVVNRTKDVGIYMYYAMQFKIYNNTIWSTFEAADSSIDMRFPPTSGEVFNNILNEGYRLRNDCWDVTFANNILYADSSLFVDQPNGDFHLVSTATDAIDKGLDTTADVPDDMDGEARPKGSAVDIGADEY
jgi:parallel beta-helix repeat protein